MSSIYDRREFFSTYFSKSTEKALFVSEFAKRFRPPSKDSLKILDLGTHDGLLLTKLLSQVKDKLPAQVDVVANDPSGPAIDDFRKRALPSGINLKLSVETAEEFFDRDADRFDWIIASHCLYWSPRLVELTKLICERSEAAVIILRGRKGIYELRSRFRHLLGNKLEQLYTADDVEAALKDLQVSFSRDEHQTHIDIPDEDSVEFLWLLSFLLDSNVDTLSKSDLEEIKAFLRPFKGRFRHDVSFFWI